MLLYAGNTWILQVESDWENYGIDWDGPVAEEELSIIDVPVAQCPISDGDFQLLQRVINPDNDSDHYGIELYLACREFVLDHAVPMTE